DLGPVPAHVVADRRTLPVDSVRACILCVQDALAVAQAGDEGAAGVLAQNVAVRAALLLESVLHDAGEALGDRAEEAVAGVDDLVGGVGAARPVVAVRPRRGVGAGIGLARLLPGLGAG